MDSQHSNEPSLSFFHIASIYPKATIEIVRNIRKYHPDNYYYLCVDATESFEYISEEFKTDYRYYTNKIGGPVSPYGYDLNRTLEFLNRFREACLRCNSSHIMMVEDDVLVIKPITVKSEWEHAGADTKIGNIIPDFLVKMIEQFSGKEMKFKQYGAGGGSIFNVLTFIENYDIIVQWFKEHFNDIQSVYPTIGYIDCFMDVYYWLCGKDYSANSYRADTHNHHPGFDYESFISNLSPEIEIVNNYKKYYFI